MPRFMICAQKQALFCVRSDPIFCRIGEMVKAVIPYSGWQGSNGVIFGGDGTLFMFVNYH